MACESEKIKKIGARILIKSLNDLSVSVPLFYLFPLLNLSSIDSPFALETVAGSRYLGRLAVPLHNALLYKFDEWRDVVEFSLLQNTLTK